MGGGGVENPSGIHNRWPNGQREEAVSCYCHQHISLVFCQARTTESLKCKVFRVERSKKGTSILPGPDSEKVIETLGDSLSGVKKELASLNKSTATDRLTRTPVQCAT